MNTTICFFSVFFIFGMLCIVYQVFTVVTIYNKVESFYKTKYFKSLQSRSFEAFYLLFYPSKAVITTNAKCYRYCSRRKRFNSFLNMFKSLYNMFRRFLVKINHKINKFLHLSIHHVKNSSNVSLITDQNLKIRVAFPSIYTI